MNIKYWMLTSALAIASCVSLYSFDKKSFEQNTQKVFYKEGIALLGLGLAGNLVACINSLESQPGSFVGSLQAICGYPVPEFPADPGMACFINNFCPKFFQKSFIFTIGGILPGCLLLWYSYKQAYKKPKKSKEKIF